MSRKQKRDDTQEKPEEKVEDEAVVEKPKKSKKVKILTVIAQKNTQLPDGTFVAKGKEVEVTAEYMERLKKAKEKDFIIK